MSSPSMTDVPPQFASVAWRVGRKVGRTIYAQMEDGASDYDALIGVMDSRLLAETAVRHHNEALTTANALQHSHQEVTPVGVPPVSPDVAETGE